jgi:hypothetical protein
MQRSGPSSFGLSGAQMLGKHPEKVNNSSRLRLPIMLVFNPAEAGESAFTAEL